VIYVTEDEQKIRMTFRPVELVDELDKLFDNKELHFEIFRCNKLVHHVIEMVKLLKINVISVTENEDFKKMSH
jgi:hypothetical protein